MANVTEKETDWIPLMDYATKYGVSLSTLRRYIKAAKIQYKLENGRYLLRAPSAVAMATLPSAALASAPGSTPGDEFEARELRASLQRAQEEIAELKTLIAFYEEQQLPQDRPGQLRMNGY